MKTSSLSVILLCMSTCAFGGHVLVFPGEYSHWLNARTIVDELVRRNHSVTVLVADASPSVKYNNSRDAAKFNFLVYKVANRQDELLTLTSNSMIVNENHFFPVCVVNVKNNRDFSLPPCSCRFPSADLSSTRSLKN